MSGHAEWSDVGQNFLDDVRGLIEFVDVLVAERDKLREELENGAALVLRYAGDCYPGMVAGVLDIWANRVRAMR